VSAEWEWLFLPALELFPSKKSFRLLTRLSFSSRCRDVRFPGGGGPLSDGGGGCLKREKSDFMGAAATAA
jgi:hypothetical protein